MPDPFFALLTIRKLSHLAVACLALTAVFPSSAMASEKEVCVSAHELYQQLSLRRQTVPAREQLLICSDPVCPRLVREDCSQWLVEMDKRLVSIPAESLVAPAPPPCVTQDVPRVHAVVPRNQPGRSLRVRSSPLAQAPWITGALGIAAFGSAAYFGIGGWQDAEGLRRTCAPNCDQSQVSAIRTRLLVADISLLAGLGFSALTAWLIWGGHPAKSTVPTDSNGGLSAAIGRGSAQVRYSANF